MMDSVVSLVNVVLIVLDRQSHTETDADEHFTPATVDVVSKYITFDQKLAGRQ